MMHDADAMNNVSTSAMFVRFLFVFQRSDRDTTGTREPTLALYPPGTPACMQ